MYICIYICTYVVKVVFNGIVSSCWWFSANKWQIESLCCSSSGIMNLKKGNSKFHFWIHIYSIKFCYFSFLFLFFFLFYHTYILTVCNSIAPYSCIFFRYYEYSENKKIGSLNWINLRKVAFVWIQTILLFSILIFFLDLYPCIFIN